MRRKPTLFIAGSPNWYCYCTVKGRRVRISLGTDDRKTAEIRSKVVFAMLSGIASSPHLASLPPDMALTFFLSLYCGMSADEISRLTWGDIPPWPTDLTESE
jgi:hypothetical protein